MAEPPFEIALAHRWFAVEFNNQAWDLVEQESRTAQEQQAMIALAHAAAVHWQAAGTSLNTQRAENLLATAYCMARKPEPAVRHAQRCIAMSEQNAAEETPFDRAASWACAAWAHQLAGDLLESERLGQLALRAAESLSADDRKVFEKLYANQS